MSEPAKSITGELIEREFGPSPVAVSPERQQLLKEYPTLAEEERKRNERQAKK
jgi:hypothetical protein